MSRHATFGVEFIQFVAFKRCVYIRVQRTTISDLTEHRHGSSIFTWMQCCLRPPILSDMRLRLSHCAFLLGVPAFCSNHEMIAATKALVIEQ